MNPVQLVCLVQDWVDFCVDYYFIQVTRFLLVSHMMVTEGHLHSHKAILVTCVPENVPTMPIIFLFHKFCLNHGLIQCLLDWLEWVDSIWCDLDICESSRNIFDSNLESSRCDFNLQNSCAQLLQQLNYFRAQYFWKICCL